MILSGGHKVVLQQNWRTILIRFISYPQLYFSFLSFFSSLLSDLSHSSKLRASFTRTTIFPLPVAVIRQFSLVFLTLTIFFSDPFLQTREKISDSISWAKECEAKRSMITIFIAAPSHNGGFTGLVFRFQLQEMFHGIIFTDRYGIIILLLSSDFFFFDTKKKKQVEYFRYHIRLRQSRISQD